MFLPSHASWLVPSSNITHAFTQEFVHSSMCVYVCVNVCDFKKKKGIILCDVGKADTAASTCICLVTRRFLFMLGSGGDYKRREQKPVHVPGCLKCSPWLIQQKRVAGSFCVRYTSSLAGTFNKFGKAKQRMIRRLRGRKEETWNKQKDESGESI